jgi:hypothetical protein
MVYQLADGRASHATYMLSVRYMVKESNGLKPALGAVSSAKEPVVTFRLAIPS